MLGLPARCQLLPFLSWGRVPLLNRLQKKGHPYSNLSTGGPSLTTYAQSQLNPVPRKWTVKHSSHATLRTFQAITRGPNHRIGHLIRHIQHFAFVSCFPASPTICFPGSTLDQGCVLNMGTLRMGGVSLASLSNHPTKRVPLSPHTHA